VYLHLMQLSVTTKVISSSLLRRRRRPFLSGPRGLQVCGCRPG